MSVAQVSEVNESLSLLLLYCPLRSETYVQKQKFSGVCCTSFNGIYLNVIVKVKLYLWGKALLQFQLSTGNLLFDGSLITKQIHQVE